MANTIVEHPTNRQTTVLHESGEGRCQIACVFKVNRAAAHLGASQISYHRATKNIRQKRIAEVVWVKSSEAKVLKLTFLS